MRTANDYLSVEPREVRDFSPSKATDFIDSIGEGLLNAWWSEGVVIVPQALDLELLKRINLEIDLILREPNLLTIPIDYRGRSTKLSALQEDPEQADFLRLPNFHTISKASRDVALNAVSARLLRSFFGDTPSLLQSLLFLKGSQQGLHQDFAYVNSQTNISHLAASWIPLEDVSPDAGPLIYFPGSHHLQPEDFFDFGDGSITYNPASSRFGPQDFESFLVQRMEKLCIPPRVYLPRAGDLLLWHGGLVHGGSIIKNSDLTRRSLVFHYTSLSSLPHTHRILDGSCVVARTELNDALVPENPWTLGMPDLVL